MTTVLLVRHGRTTANDAGVLAGWADGVSLDETGQAQVRSLAGRLTPVPLVAVVTSPLQRCRETTDLLVEGQGRARAPGRAPGRVRYGEWTGQELKKLAKEPLWKVVQAHPSGDDVPRRGRESLRAMADRAVDAVRDWNSRLASDKKEAVYAVVSHGDVIKAILADALGMHLDQFQRLVVDPGSVSVVSYTPLRPFVLRVNDVGGDLTLPRAAQADAAAGGRRRRPRPPVGGGLGAAGLGIGSAHGSRHPRVRPAGPVRGGHGRRARPAHLLPAGHRRRPDHQRRPGEAAGDRARRAGRRAARRGGAAQRRRGAGPGRPGRGRRATTTRWTCRSWRSSGSAPWRWPGTATTSGWSSRRRPVTEDDPDDEATLDDETERRAAAAAGARSPGRRRGRSSSARLAAGRRRPAALPVLRLPAATRRGHVCPRANGYRR